MPRQRQCLGVANVSDRYDNDRFERRDVLRHVTLGHIACARIARAIVIESRHLSQSQSHRRRLDRQHRHRLAGVVPRVGVRLAVFTARPRGHEHEHRRGLRPSLVVLVEHREHRRKCLRVLEPIRHEKLPGLFVERRGRPPSGFEELMLFVARERPRRVERARTPAASNDVENVVISRGDLRVMGHDGSLPSIIEG